MLINIGNRIREFRKERGISAKEIAISLGVSSSFISGIEKGTNKCSLETLDKICTILGVSLAEFFADKALAHPTEKQVLLTPEVRQVIEKVKKLSPRQIKILNAVLNEWKTEAIDQNYSNIITDTQDQGKVEYYYKISEQKHHTRQPQNNDKLADGDIDTSNIVLVAEAEGREEMHPLSPELQTIVKDAIKVSRQKRKEEAKGNKLPGGK